MKIQHQTTNPLHMIRRLETPAAKRADLPQQITPEVAEPQQSDINALIRESPLLIDLQTLLATAPDASKLSRQEIIDYSVDRIVEHHLLPGSLTEADRQDMRQTISDFIQRDPHLARKFESILQRLSSLNGRHT